MPDSLALPVLAGSAITQGFTFLYGQLTDLLRRRREGRLGEEQDPQSVEAPSAMLAITSPLVANPLTVESRIAELESLAELLAVYETHRTNGELDGTDLMLRIALGRLRGALEVVYGQPLSFVGEERGKTEVIQRIDDLHGSSTGVRATGPQAAIPAGSVTQEVKTVHEGGDLTGIEINDSP